MGKIKHNWKARQVKQTMIDNSATEKIKLDINTKGNYDEANPLVLPSQKRKTKTKNDKEQTKILSKKQRKRLQHIVDKKKKKQMRVELLSKLAEVEISPEVKSQLTSISSMQTKGIKRHLHELESGVKISNKIRRTQQGGGECSNTGIHSIAMRQNFKRPLKGWRGKSYNQELQEQLQKRKELLKSNDPNVVGFYSDSSSDDDSSGEDEEKMKKDAPDEEKMKKDAPDEEKIKKDAPDEEKMKKGAPDEEKMKKDAPDEENKEVTEQPDRPVESDKFKGDSVCREDLNVKIRVAKQPSEPAIYVLVIRKPAMEHARNKLPILAEEQVVMEAISKNPVVIIAGETGSGKTTQVPQFLYEAGYARNGKMIGITEPRRVAAISMAKRVAEELDLTSREVSHLVRFEGNVTEDTKIKFMTDGVLLKEMQKDFVLSRYSVIILDEAHERSVYTDILIGLLSRLVLLRKTRKDPLKLIIMSATLRMEDFTNNPRLFKVTPPVIKVEGRQFPVTIHYNKRTSPDYCFEAFRKVCRIHIQLPEGGILVFLSGQQEVNYLVRRLRKAFPYKNSKDSARNNKTYSHDDERSNSEDEDFYTKKSIRKRRKEKEMFLPEINLDDYTPIPEDDTKADLLEQDDAALDNDDEDYLPGFAGLTKDSLWVLPLYSLLPAHEQAKVFMPPPEGCRLCVVSTNVAETSLTIPNVKYVVDSGKCKVRLYDKYTGVSSYEVQWSSKAAADQRAGRAGRVGPGHCYRLFSSAVYNDNFPAFSVPEIQRRPVEDLLLQMKSMSIIKVVNFPFPSPPDRVQLKVAEKKLQWLGALPVPKLDATEEEAFSGKLTKLGRSMSAFPVSPRFAKMLVLSHQHDLLPLVICLVAALSVQEVLTDATTPSLVENTSKNVNWNEQRRKWAGKGHSKLLGDPMVLLRAVGAAEYAGSCGDLVKFCNAHGLRHKAVVEIRKLRVQLTNEFNLNVPGANVAVDPQMKPPTDIQARLLRQVVLSGMVDHVAQKVDLDEVKDGEDKRKWKHAYRTPEMENPVFMHSSSALRKDLPTWVVYQEIYENDGKMYMRGITAIEPEWLPVYATPLCNISEPLNEPPPRFDTSTKKLLCHVSSTFGRSGWPLPVREVDFPPSLNRYKWFLRFLLDGTVLPKLKKFVPSLLSSPTFIVKTWAKLHPRTEAILRALIGKEVDSYEKLLAVWIENKDYLMAEYKEWVPESAYATVTEMWPPM